MLNSFLFDSIYWSITLCIPIPQCFHIQYLGLMPKISSQLLLVSVLVFIEMVTWKKMLSFSCSFNFHFHGLYIYSSLFHVICMLWFWNSLFIELSQCQTRRQLWYCMQPLIDKCAQGCWNVREATWDDKCAPGCWNNLALYRYNMVHKITDIVNRVWWGCLIANSIF